MDRRKFLGTMAGAAAALALRPAVAAKRREKALRILQWSHFVPSYDAWFDQYARDWGRAHRVEVTVDHIALADLGTRANAEVAAQQGHDLFQFLSPPGAFEPQVLDMADVVQEAERQHGPILDLCKRSTYNPVTRKWFGFSDNYVPDPGDYLKSVWTEIGMPDGPAKWEDLVKAAPLIKDKHPEIQIPIGIGMSQELGMLVLDERGRLDQILPLRRAVGHPDLGPDAFQVVAGVGHVVVAEPEPLAGDGVV